MFFKRTGGNTDDYFNGKRIGIIGLGPRNGTTHIAIALCNYLSECRHKRVCLAEQNRHNDISRFLFTLGYSSCTEIVTHHRVTYIPSFNDIIPLFNMKYDCMVFDLGHDLERSINAMNLCDIKIAVGTDAPWRRNEYALLKNLKDKNHELSGWRLFVNLGNPRLLKDKDEYQITAGCFPFEPDPVYPSKETISFLEEII
ncbi:MAG: hypothetical protein IKP88_03780 [Lachnospiraceae bacterium]|nr:hypothetical protein [Lachnospiraceae bacterium]